MRLLSRSPLFASLVWVGSIAAAEPANKTAEVNGIIMSYVEEGMGEPVVFVHGAVADSRIWEPVRHEFSDDYRYIAPTLRYFGTADWPEGELNFDDVVYVKDLAAFIEGLDAGPVHLVGWSWGNQISLAVALERPDLVRDLLLFEPAMDKFLNEGEAGEPARTAAGKMFDPVKVAVEEGDAEKATRLLVEGVLEMEPGGFNSLPAAGQQIFLDNARGFLEFWPAAGVEITCEMLGRLDKPVLVAHGGDSNAFWVQIAEGTGACLPQAKVASLAGVNHGGPMQDPAGFATMVENFLASH